MDRGTQELQLENLETRLNMASHVVGAMALAASLTPGAMVGYWHSSIIHLNTANTASAATTPISVSTSAKKATSRPLSTKGAGAFVAISAPNRLTNASNTPQGPLAPIATSTTATTTTATSTTTTTSAPTTPTVSPLATWQEQWFNAMGYSNMPANLNMSVMSTDGNPWFQTQGDSTSPIDQAHTQQYAVAAFNSGTRYLAIDIETFPTDIRKDNAATVNAAVAKYVQIVKWIKAAEPTLQVGAFGYPFADYYSIELYEQGVAAKQGITLKDTNSAYWVGPGANEALGYYQNLEKANDALQPLLSMLDFAAPELYTHIDVSTPAGLQDWELFAQGAIAEARRVMPGKPVLPYLMPQYTPDIALAWQAIPADAWKAEVQTVWKYADGGVLFGGWGPSGRLPWDQNAAWWQPLSDGSYKNQP